MAGQDFYTMTPGSAVADTLQDILARKQAQKQQDFINNLSLRKQQEDESYRDMQAQSLAEERQARIAQMQSSDWERRAQLHGGDTASDLTPDDLQYGLQHGWLTQDHIADITGAKTGDPMTGGQPIDMANPQDTNPTYHWADTDKSRAAKKSDADDKAAIAQINAMEADPKNADYKDALEFAKVHPGAQRDTILNTIVQRMLPTVNKDQFDTAILLPNNKFSYHGQTVNSVPPGVHIERGFEPPQPNAANVPQLWQVNDPSGALDVSGNPKQVSILASPGDFQAHLNDPTWLDQHKYTGGQIHHGNETNVKPQPLYDQNAFNRFAITATNAGNGKAADDDVAAARANVVRTIPDPNLQQDVTAILKEADARGNQNIGPIDRFFGGAQPKPPLDEAAIRSLIQPPPGVTGPAAQAYIENVIKIARSLKAIP